MNILLTGVLLLASGVLAGPIEDLAVNAWYEVPNSHLNSVAPSGWSANVIDPWCSGAFDTKRNNLIVWGGGHGDYAGNEIYVFNLDSLKWIRVNNPSDPPAKDVPYAADGGPCSRHTYDYIQYVPAVDRFCSFGGAGFWQSGQTGTNNLDAFNFDARTWSQYAVVPSCGGNIGSISAVDAGTGYAWYHGTGTYSWAAHWNPATNVWTVHGKTWSMEELDYNHTAAIDPRRHKMVAIGSGTVLVWNLQPDTGYIFYTQLSTSGAAGIVSNGNPGVEYDPVSDRIVAWDGGSGVYTLDMDTRVWTLHNGAGATPTAGAQWGTYGRFRYSPKNNVFVGVNSISQNVFIYRLTSGSGTNAELKAPALDETAGLTVSPNPFHAAAIITVNGQAAAISVYDIHGRSVDRLASLDGRAFTWSAARHPAGVYLARAVVDGKVCQNRVIKMK